MHSYQCEVALADVWTGATAIECCQEQLREDLDRTDVTVTYAQCVDADMREGVEEAFYDVRFTTETPLTADEMENICMYSDGDVP